MLILSSQDFRNRSSEIPRDGYSRSRRFFRLAELSHDIMPGDSGTRDAYADRCSARSALLAVRSEDLRYMARFYHRLLHCPTMSINATFNLEIDYTMIRDYEEAIDQQSKLHDLAKSRADNAWN